MPTLLGSASEMLKGVKKGNPNGIYNNRILFFLDLYFHRFT